MVHTTCSALHCFSSSRTNKSIRFHQFPCDEERRKIWITACQRTDVLHKDWNFFKNKYVCSLHFQKCMYSKKDNLKKSAIPSLNLTDKPMQHDVCTQTWDSMEYVKPDQDVQNNKLDSKGIQTKNDVSILYVMPNIEKMFTSSYTQTEDSLPFQNLYIEVKEEIAENVEIEDSDTSEIGEEIKIEIEEHEVLPHTQSTQSKEYLKSDDFKEIESETSCTQAEKPIEDKKQEKEGTLNKIVSSTTEDLINTANKLPVKTIRKRKVHKTIQTDKLIVYNVPKKRKVRLNPQYCECERIKTKNKRNTEEITRSQFLTACDKYLSAEFSAIVKNAIELDMLNEKLFSSITDQNDHMANAGTSNSEAKTACQSTTDSSPKEE